MPFSRRCCVLASYGLNLSVITVPASIFIVAVTISWLVFLLASLRYRPKAFKCDVSMQPFFSVLIPAHNEENVIGDIASDFANQTYSDFEVIVICHNCSDGTFVEASRFKNERLKVLNLQTRNSGKAIPLNEGLKVARGDVIVQMDADNRVNPDFLSKAAKYFGDSSVDTIQVKVSTKNADFNLLTKFQQLEYEMFGICYWEGRNVLRRSCTIGGTGVMFRKSVLESVGGWDNELIEDYDLYCKLGNKGFQVTYAPDVECFDEKPPYWSSLMKQRARWIRGHFLVCKKRLFDRFSLVDFIYMVSPFFYVAWYLCSILTVSYLIGELVGFSVTYWYIPAYAWIASLVIMYGLFVRRLLKKRMFTDLVYIPMYFIFSFHWLIAFLQSLTIKTWAETKTAHGYVTT